MQRTVRAWLELMRPPNALTVPGDVFAGFLLAAGATSTLPLIATTGAALFFYQGGLALNDGVDAETDRRERPGRPVPRGDIAPAAALRAGCLLLAAGLTLAWWAGPLAIRVAAVLTATILVYNLLTKNIPVLGALSMGACRGLNVLMGMAAAGAGIHGAALIAAGLTMLYVTGITMLARNEAAPGRHIQPRHIATLLRGLLVLQALFCFAAPARPMAIGTGLFLLALWPLHRSLARHFHAS